MSGKNSDPSIRRIRTRRKALVDALAGVVGALVSLWTFYPIEVFKTNLQAGNLISKIKVTDYFRGCFPKSLHTASSNFCYFYIYSWIFSYWKRNYPKNDHGMNTATRLCLAAVAAMLNTLITLPLDVLASKHVATSKKPQREEGKQRRQTLQMDAVWEEDEYEYDDEQEEKDQKEKGERAMTNFQEEKKEEVPLLCQEENTAELSPLDANKGKEFKISKNGNWSDLWKGFTPAILLCSNPSINYTAFDVIKSKIISGRTIPRPELSMVEAFLIGLLAKAVATVATYPLIRAKVILMVTSEKSLFVTLCRTYKDEGVRGLYRGCNWQLMHTVLKSALMMMVREKITYSTQRFLMVQEKT